MILTLSGPSSSGKTTLLEGLKGDKKLRKDLGLSPLESITTRPRRPTDVDGEYRYVDDLAFDDLNAKGAFAWVVQPYGNTRYGTRALTIERALLSSKLYVAILTLDALQKLHVIAAQKNLSHRLMSICLVINDTEGLRSRMRRRGDTDGPEMESRIRSAAQEVKKIRQLEKELPLTILDAEYPEQELAAQALYHVRQTFVPA